MSRIPPRSSASAQAKSPTSVPSSASSSATSSAPTPTAGVRPSASPAELRQRRSQVRMPGEDLSIAESLRVMDVAREIRDRRTTAEEMFRHDSVRQQLRDKLLATARLSGDPVTEAEIDVAIEHYFANLHTYQTPPAGMKRFLATCWVWRGRIAMALTAAAATGFWIVFF